MSKPPQCQSLRTYCGHDPAKLAGTEPACQVCRPFMARHREAAGYVKQGELFAPKAKAKRA